MDADGFFAVLIGANLAGAAAILLVFAFRPVVRRIAGSGATYGLWIVPPLAALASLLPAAGPRPLGPQAETALQMALAVPAALDWQGPILALWSTGVMVALARLLVAHRRTLRSLGGLSLEDGGLLRAEAPGVGPAVFGVLTPRIVVPADFEARFDADERAVMLAHEAAHLRGGHLLAKAAAQLALCLNWFNPAVHLAVHAMTADQEMACDEAVIGRHPDQRRAYAQALLKTQAGRSLAFGCAWPSRSTRLLKTRMHLVTRPGKGAVSRIGGLVLVSLIASAAGLTAWAKTPEPAVAAQENPVWLAADGLPIAEPMQPKARPRFGIPVEKRPGPAAEGRRPAMRLGLSRPVRQADNSAEVGGEAAQASAFPPDEISIYEPPRAVPAPPLD